MYLRKKYKIRNSNDFYMVGGMGHTASVALGYLYYQKKRLFVLMVMDLF